MLTLGGLIARLLDVALILGGAALGWTIRSGSLTPAASATAVAASTTAFSAAISLALLAAVGVYQSRPARSLSSFAGQILFAWLATQICTVLVMFSIHRVDLVSRLWFGYWTVATAVALITSRLIAHIVLSRTRHARLNLRRVAIAGTREQCDALMRKMQAAPDSAFRPVMTLDLHATCGMSDAAVPRYASTQAFVQRVRSENVRELWLALALSEEPRIAALVDEFRNDLINIRFFPDVRSLALFDGGVIDLLGVPAINLVASPLSPLALAKKDIFDRAFAALALLAVAPLMLVIALAVKLSSRGPVLFTQRRKGADGDVFRIFKFRSMTVHALETGVLKQAIRNDPRVTRVGAFLRRTSLDELPQFFNVLIGDMSVVGPRPHAIEHDALYQTVVDDYIHRYRIKPGITGWAQVNGFRGETDGIEKMQGRVDHDLYYLRNWSFALDMRIVIATVMKGLKHSNAY
ncbi:undecaprenyl-phosphate glucose phosphotransferase [Caballeronia sordidicola]|uniref:undecaprenyl-phosphate glucose phosphotransferase n=1 Tax=Caballeronia sordidicola TaxID=196367 RepID=UPI0004D0070B|nr:undecaprenyl-phosphate glucose phosphotransferase [Caballeronia sordidicola]